MCIRVFILLTFCLASNGLFAQVVPNSGFENWDFNGWNYSPTDWSTENSQVFETVFQDSAAYEGVLAMRVESMPLPLDLGEEGHAIVQVPLSFIPPSLEFYAKYDRTSTAAVGVTVQFYNGENVVSSDTWWAPDLSSEWTGVTLPFTQVLPIITHAIIDVWVLIGDEAPGDGWISVDAMGFAAPDGLEEADAIDLRVYPNPVSEELFLEYDPSQVGGLVFRLVDMSGRSMEVFPVNNRIDVRAMMAGYYILLIENDAGAISERTVEIVR